MNKRLSDQMGTLLKSYQKHKKLMNMLAIAVVVVIAATGIVISLPADTATVELICGQEEHTHTEDCYDEEQTLVCGLEEHAHTADCYEQAGTLTSETSDRMTSEVSYDAGVIHYNTTLSAELLTDNRAKTAAAEIEQKLADTDLTADTIKVYDLTLIKNEQEVEPEGKVSVVFTFENPVTAQTQENTKEVTWQLYHILDNNTLINLTNDRKTIIETNADNAVTKVSFETDSFSKYVLAGAIKTETESIENSDSANQNNEDGTEAAENPVESDESVISEETENTEDITDTEDIKDTEDTNDTEDTKDIENTGNAAEAEIAGETEDSTKAEEEQLKAQYPEQSFEASANGITVSVSAEAGAFPKGTTMSVTKIADKKVLNKAIDISGTDGAKAKAVDISFKDENGKEIEPARDIRVTLKSKVVAGTGDITIVHVDDSSRASVVDQIPNQKLSKKEKPAADEVIFDSSEFSAYAIVYTVDFSYGQYDYSIEGGSEILLSKLLKELHIYNEDQELLTVDDVSKVSFSDESLVKVSAVKGDWKLTSLKPFQTDETLTLTLKNGDVVVVDVTDDQTDRMTVTGVTLTVNGTTYDLKDTTSVKIKDTDALVFRLDYVVPSRTLSPDNNIIEYQLPEGIKIKEAISNKNIEHKNEIVGTYSIDTNGKITFVYNKDYATKNANGSEITADLSFSASVDSSNIPDGGKIPISFSDELEVDVNVEKSEVGDLTVYKQEERNNFSDGYIVYRINVNSTAGTSSEVKLTDVITNSGLDITSLSDFTIEPNNNNITPTWNGKSGFGVTLPKLDANSSYTITYRVNYDKTKVPLNGVSINNKITGESTASKGTKLEHSYNVKTDVKPNDTITKKATTYDPDNNIVSWEIKINGSKSNLNGWTLQDTLNGVKYEGTVHVEPAIDGKNEITLPYTWNGDDRNTYTITYTTTADKLLGNNSVVNKAELTKGNESVSPGDSHAGWTEPYNPLSKDATNITPNADDTLATIDWKVTINASQGPIPAGWTFKDELWDGQWFTGKQLKEIKAAINKALSDAGLNLSYTMEANLQKGTDGVGDKVDENQIKDDGKYKVYTLKFTSELPRGKSFTFSYQSTAPIEEYFQKKENKDFRNRSVINDKVIDDGNIVYHPPKDPEIIKTDNKAQDDTLKKNPAEETAHNITSLDQTFEWNVKVTIPSDYGSKGGTTLTVKEHLPAGVSLEDLEILAQGTNATIFGATHWESPHLGSNILNIEGLGGPYRVELLLSQRDDGGLDATVTIPESLIKHSAVVEKDGKNVDNAIQEVRFVVKVKPTDSSKWTKDGDGYLYKKFGNTVELINKDNQTIDTDSHDQTITLKDGKKLVSKSVGASDNGKFDANYVPYSLKINEDGKDLVQGAETITLTDILKYEYNIYYLLNVTYSTNSLKVYYMKDDGSKGDELPEDQYSFTYEEEIDYENKTNNNPIGIRTLKVVLPDSTPLIVEYKYKVSDTDNAGRNTHLSNRAYLDGYNENRYSDEKNTYVIVQNSDAHASVEGITLKKVDADNFGIKLEGVKFNLYKYDENSNTYVKTDKTYTTDNFGEINFTRKDIAYETAYKLVEESTLPGYFSEKAPYYFIVTDVTLKENEEPHYTAPEDFDGTVYSVGASFYFKNRKIPEKGLSVSKVWKDYDGNVIDDTTNMPEITARLKKNGEVIQTFTLSEENGWTEVFKDLDPKGQYTVEEATTLTGYKAAVIVYEQGDGETVSYISGGSYGSATITNQPNNPPPSGGTTNVAVKKKWVDTDGKTELTGVDLEGLEAKVELVRYKAPQQGTTVHFVIGESNESTNYQYKYRKFFEDVVLATKDSVTISFKASNWDNLLWIQDHEIADGTPFHQDNTEANKMTGSGNSSTGEIIMTYTFSTAGKNEIYLYANAGNYNLNPEKGITIASGSEGSYGTPERDRSYSGSKVTLNSSNNWNAVFTGLPIKGTENGITYSYTYAVKETSSDKLFELEGYSTGSDSVDGSNIPISNTGNNITVTNKKKEVYELPHTGGTGTLKYILSGFSLMIIALLLYFRRKPEGRRAMEKG